MQTPTSTPGRYEVATFAAGSAIAATERVLDGESCFALVRPRATTPHRIGRWAFASSTIRQLPRQRRSHPWIAWRLLTGTYTTGTGRRISSTEATGCWYCSVHAEDFFPGTGAATDTGTGAGAGCTVNAPLPQKSTIGDYVHVFSDLFLPLLKRAHPDLVIVSAGQDALADDPVGGMGLLPVDYGTLAGLLLDALDLPPAFVLEGGYGPSHPAAINAILGAVSGKRSSEPVPEPSAGARERVRILRKLHGLR